MTCRLQIWLMTIAAAHVCAGAALGQSTLPKSYSDYYRSQTRKTGRVSTSPAQYTYNRIYYHNPAISPYTNLARRNPTGSNSYYSYVLPERRRREQAVQRQQSADRARRQSLVRSANIRRSRSAPPPRSKVIHSSYYKQFYGLK